MWGTKPFLGLGHPWTLNGSSEEGMQLLRRVFGEGQDVPTPGVQATSFGSPFLSLGDTGLIGVGSLLLAGGG